MLLRIQKYALKIQHFPGKEMYVADMFSHAYLHEEPSTSNTYYQLFQLSQEAQVYKNRRN